MEPVARKIEELTDGTGRVRSSLLRTLRIDDRQTLETLCKRLEAEEKLLGCEGAVCHLEYWTDPAENGWTVTVRSRGLTSLRTYLAGLAMEQEELIVLPAKQSQAKQHLRLYRDSVRLPDRAVLELGVSVCHGLAMAEQVGLTSCPVNLDTIYRTPQGRWVLGDLFLTGEKAVDTEGLVTVMHQLLGGTEEDGEPAYGGSELCLLIRLARKKSIDPAELSSKLEGLLSGKADQREPVKEKKAASSLKPAGNIVTEAKKQIPASERKIHTWGNPMDQEAPDKKPIQEPYRWKSILTKEKPASKPSVEEQIRKKVHLSSMISAGDGFTAAVRRNGTVLSTRIFAGLTSWTGVKAVAVGGSHLLGLQEDGRVLVVGNNFHGQCDVCSWKNIIQIAAGMSYSAGLQADGKLVVAGWVGDKWKQSGQWTELAAIAAGSQHLVGLRKDGTVIAEGNSQQGQCNVGAWKNIVAISAGGIHTVGLKADGTVVAAGANLYGQCAVQDWTDIIAVDAGADHTIGLKADGTVVGTGNFSFGARAVEDWKNVIAISAGWSTTVGLTAEGVLLATGKNDYGQCDVGNWRGLV